MQKRQRKRRKASVILRLFWPRKTRHYLLVIEDPVARLDTAKVDPIKWRVGCNLERAGLSGAAGKLF